MSEFNPYQQPQSDVAVEQSAPGMAVHAPMRRPLGAGARWISDAWALFTKNPGLWIGGMLVLWLLGMAAGMFPIIGFVIGIVINPLIYAGAYIVAHKSDRGDAVRFEDFFAGFQWRTGSLLALGGISFAMIVAVTVFCGVIAWQISGGDFSTLSDNWGALADGDAPAASGLSELFLTKLVLIALIWLLILVPYLALMWFALPLIVLSNEMTIGRALKWSFVGCFKNIIPMTLYSIVLFILLLIGMIPAFLGLLVVTPLLMISLYISFRDIYVDA
jgi:uncharacterized membrane protein